MDTETFNAAMEVVEYFNDLTEEKLGESAVNLITDGSRAAIFLWDYRLWCSDDNDDDRSIFDQVKESIDEMMEMIFCLAST